MLSSFELNFIPYANRARLTRGVKTRKGMLESQDFFGYDGQMKVILFRHAEKENMGSSNPPLTHRGQQQAKKIIEEIQTKKIPRPQVLLVSPRARSQQTFSPLSDILKIKSSVTPLLDERTSNESSEDFRRRVQELLVLLQMDYPNDECIFLCTHYDWIQEFLSIVECTTDLTELKYQHWNSCQWMWLNKNELWDLVKFDHVKV